MVMKTQQAAANQANKIVEKLAVACGVRMSEMVSFIECLNVWTSKGYTIEQAIENHMRQMARLVNNSRQLADDLKPVAVEWFYTEAA